MELLGNLRQVFAERLCHIREAKKWTQHDLAAASGLSVHTIRGYEQEKSWPQPEDIESLAGALGVTITELMSERPIKSSVLELMEILPSLNESEAGMALEVIKELRKPRVDTVGSYPAIRKRMNK